ncbi:heparan-alpha-glucosaminide N-acetyltransferase domain-containing protein [Maribacter sp. CXY002]|uniref:heparan-alpha-glucosaminide N-acetyltransferase domain-containing protein n=1 Tax=Maribacter luteocoastalis TaxID=3407671 RepID=UPI003B6776BC
MNKSTTRLYFIDAIRAWAILMMLQGHFIDGLLDNTFRDNSNIFFSVWKYFRGITAPVFFTVSGFIFTYLLIKVPQTGWANPRVKKGIKRGIELLVIGYLLRMNFLGLLKGEIYESFYLVDVLHCIGLSILGILAIYLLSNRGKQWLFPSLLLISTLILFVFEPYYKTQSFSLFPQWLANYFTKTNGSVFTIIPWFGYTAFGSFISILFAKYKDHKHLYTGSISLFMIIGLTLIFYSSDFFLALSNYSGITLFSDIFYNNYLFIRLGNVLLVFSVFMLFRQFLTNKTGLRLGQSTLSIYVIHFMILYGSLTGLGLYRFFHHSLHPIIAILGAVVFMIISSYLALRYEDHKVRIKQSAAHALNIAKFQLEKILFISLDMFRSLFNSIIRLFGFVKN